MAGIDVRGLRKVYPNGLVALDDVNFVVEEGEIFGLLGPNGSGKTTTIGVLTTRVRASGGEVVVAGWDARQQPIDVRRSTGVATQANTLDRSLTVAEELYFHCRYHGFDRQAARAASNEAIERFELGAVAGQSTALLSGGYVRRTLLARAVAHRPAIVFLDEPTLGLDPLARRSLWDCVRDLKKTGVTIMMTTHYLHEVEVMCDRVAILRAGSIVASGSPTELTGGRDLVTVSVGLAGDIAGFVAAVLPDVLDAVASDGGQVTLLAEDLPSCLDSIARAARLTAAHVRSVSTLDESLEALFLAVTGAGE